MRAFAYTRTIGLSSTFGTKMLAQNIFTFKHSSIFPNDLQFAVNSMHLIDIQCSELPRVRLGMNLGDIDLHDFG